MKHPSVVWLAGALLALAALPAFAGAWDREAAEAASKQREAVTVYVDADWGRRTSGVARQLTEAHAAFAAHGYRLLDVEPYVENDDLQGFFVSYVRAAKPASTN